MTETDRSATLGCLPIEAAAPKARRSRQPAGTRPAQPPRHRGPFTLVPALRFGRNDECRGPPAYPFSRALNPSDSATDAPSAART